MQVDNRFHEKSLADMSNSEYEKQQEQWLDLQEITELCVKNGEKILFGNILWEQNVRPDQTFADWLYGYHPPEEQDLASLIMELISKGWSQKEIQEPEKGVRRIWISIVESEEMVTNRREYLEVRRSFLDECQRADEYGAFMASCFPESVFAEDIQKELKNVEAFREQRKEITRGLSVLNDQGIELYWKYYPDLHRAMKELATIFPDCSLDPAHREFFDFIFEMDPEITGSMQYKTVNCEPHLKLIHKGSNLRVYFYWRDEEIGNGKKVLIGRIGRHPY